MTSPIEHPPRVPGLMAAFALLVLLPGCAREHRLPSELQTQQCRVAPTTIDFDTVTVSQSADRTFTITNIGGGNLSGTASSPCSDFSIVGSANYSLGGGRSATITVRFTPAVSGPRTCTISTGASCASVAARGNARPGATRPASRRRSSRAP